MAAAGSGTSRLVSMATKPSGRAAACASSEEVCGGVGSNFATGRYFLFPRFVAMAAVAGSSVKSEEWCDKRSMPCRPSELLPRFLSCPVALTPLSLSSSQSPCSWESVFGVAATW
jgi:hypothetical protein